MIVDLYFKKPFKISTHLSQCFERYFSKSIFTTKDIQAKSIFHETKIFFLILSQFGQYNYLYFKKHLKFQFIYLNTSTDNLINRYLLKQKFRFCIMLIWGSITQKVLSLYHIHSHTHTKFKGRLTILPNQASINICV